MKQIQIDFQNNIFLFDLDESNYNETYNETYDKIGIKLKEKYNLDIDKDEYYITTRNKLIPKDWDFYNSDEHYYKAHIKVKGGFIKVLKELTEGIIKIAKLVVKIPGFIVWLVMFVIWVITEVLNPVIFFQDLANSIFTIIKTIIFSIFDVLTGSVKYIVDTIANPVLSSFWGYTPAREKNTYAIISSGKKTDDFLIIKKSKESFDKIFKPGTKVIIQSSNDAKYELVSINSTELFSGTEKYGKTKVKINEKLQNNYSTDAIMAIPSKYGTGENKAKCGKKKCIQLTNPANSINLSGGGSGLNLGNIIGDLTPPENKSGVPTSIIISTIFLPPLGLFMELGLKGWFNILICALLTFFYYFPGLIYALIIIYC